MRKFLIITILLSAHLLIVSCSKDKDSPSENQLIAKTLLDISYGNNAQQKFDLYLPGGRSVEKTKTIILVHGGGWVEGDKADMAFLIPYIKQNHPKYAIANVNYVLADINTPAFPNQFLDLDAVIKKLTEEKDEFQILPEFALIGVSAGAHLSLMYDYVYDTDNQVKMVADIVGPTDFTDPFYINDPNFPVLMAVLVDENAYPPGTDFAAELSPALKVSGQSSPTLLFYGNNDPLVPLSNANTLNAALNDHEIDHTLTVYNGGHADWAPNDLENVKSQISSYINVYLKILE